MDQKQGIPSDQPLYPAQPPPAYPGQQPAVAGQQPQGYPVQQQSGYPGQPGYPVQQQSGYPGQPGYPVQQQPGYPGQPGYPIQQQPGYPGQPQPGYGGQVVITMPLANKMNNNLILAIIATLCCCPICGIVGIVYAAQVDSAFFRGDVAQAQNYADNAKKWSIAAIVGGCLWIAIVIVYQIIAFTVIYPSY